jgi:hypothetical protein
MTDDRAHGRSAPASVPAAAAGTTHAPGALAAPPAPAVLAPAGHAPAPARAAPVPDDVFEAKVLRSFFRDGRLVSIPAQDQKKRVVLRHLRDLCFKEERAYPEKEVNQRLALFHPDVAALRRYLVDFGLMTRASGEYRRA